MLIFDPTIDRSRDLLEPPVPDLLIVRSESPSNTDPPWRPSSGDVLLNIAWIEYAAVDRNEHHNYLTFFDIHSASTEQKRRISDYLAELDDGEKALGWYRCKITMADCLDTLSNVNTIHCHKRSSAIPTPARENSGSRIVFQRMAYPSVKHPLSSEWAYLVIEPSGDFQGIEDPSNLTMESNLEQVAEYMREDQPSGEPTGQGEMLTLYMVTMSKKPSLAQAVSEDVLDEDKIAT